MFKNVLLNLINENKLTQKELGFNTGIPPSTINNWIKTERKPDYDSLIKLADFFEVSIDYLTERTNDFGFLKQPSKPTEELSSEEYLMLKTFRKLNNINKKNITATINTFVEIQTEEENYEKTNQLKRKYKT